MTNGKYRFTVFDKKDRYNNSLVLPAVAFTLNKRFFSSNAISQSSLKNLGNPLFLHACGCDSTEYGTRYSFGAPIVEGGDLNHLGDLYVPRGRLGPSSEFIATGFPTRGIRNGQNLITRIIRPLEDAIIESNGLSGLSPLISIQRSTENENNLDFQSDKRYRTYFKTVRDEEIGRGADRKALEDIGYLFPDAA